MSSVNPIASLAGHRQLAVRLPRRVLARRSDEQLMELVHTGDDGAFEALYERHATGVLSFCRHMLGSQEEAEEAVQRAFVSVHLGILQASGGGVSFKPWVYTIARNHCASVLRQRRPAKRREPAAGLSTAGLRQEVAHRDDLREILADIERLPERQREAFVLTELRDLSLEQVAEVLGQEPSTVKGLVFRARSTMIERSDARRIDCIGVRESLQTADDRELARGPLRYHLDVCPDCSAYLGSLHRQRRLLGLALPVMPAVALKKSVMASVGAGGTGAGAGVGAGAGAGVGVGMGSGAGAGGVAGGTVVGAAATSGASLAGSGVLAKVAIVGVLAGSTGVAADAVHETGARAAVEPGPAGLHQRAGSPSADGQAALPESPDGSVPAVRVPGGPAAGAPVAAHVPAAVTAPLASALAGGPIALVGSEHPATHADDGSTELDLASDDSLGLGDALPPEEVLDGDLLPDEPPLPPAPEVELPPLDVPAPVDVPVDVPPVDVPPVEVPPVDLPPVDVLPPVEIPPVDLPPIEVLPADEVSAHEPSADQPPADEPPGGQPPADAPSPEPPPADDGTPAG
jgi:RNA polymerase sigma factor (sigma-70 family)